MTFGAASVGRRLDGAALVPGTVRPLRFRGRTTVTVPAGREVTSDAVSLRFRRFQELAVSLYVRGSTPAASEHFGAFETSYVAPAGSGDHASDPGGGAFAEPIGSWLYVADVEVQAPGRTGAVVAVGDSITDGANSTPGANRRWPDLLARRLAAAGRGLAVQNAGISGNRWTRRRSCPGGPRLFGPSLVDRLGRDVLDQRGVTDAIVLEGTNDLSDAPGAPRATAREVIAGLHRWVRTSGIPFSDFHAAVRDRADPDRLRPAYDSGDGLHPNDAGMRAMARAVRLSLLRGPACAD